MMSGSLTIPTTLCVLLLIRYATLYTVVDIRLQRSNNPLYNIDRVKLT